MPFFKRENNEIVSASTHVYTKDYTLSEDDHLEYTYPLDGWVWATDLESAIPLLQVTPEYILAWQGRCFLASMPAITDGPLSNISGSNMLDQINILVESVLDAPAKERFKGTLNWNRNDIMLNQFMTLGGFTQEQIDQWFVVASQIE